MITTEQPGRIWNFDIWTIDLARNVMKRLTTDPAREFDPAWSPDSHDIAFTSSRIDGRFSLFRRSVTVENGDELLLQSVSASASGPSWSRNNVLVFTEGGGQSTGADLYTLSLAGNHEKQPFLKTRFNESAGEFSPNGQWIAYQSNESNRNEVYMRPFPQGKEVLVSRDGGRAPRWKGDGKELFFLAPDGRLMSSNLDTTTGLQPTVPIVLFQTPIVFAGNNHPYAVTPDGQRFLIPVPVNPPGPAPVTVLLNWTARLPR